MQQFSDFWLDMLSTRHQHAHAVATALWGPDFSQEVNVRGFSAGSFSGLAFLHILWSIPRVTTKGYLGAIACPPSLLDISRAKANDQLHFHYESDRLLQLQDSCTSDTYITNEIASYKGHFGPSEHDYSHWLALNLSCLNRANKASGLCLRFPTLTKSMSRSRSSISVLMASPC